MRHLILMRHAKSDWNHPGLGDHDRPLNDRGKRSAAAMGDWLKRKGYVPGEVLCSSAVRTRQTLELLRLDPGVPVSFTRTLYLAEAEEMLAVLRRATADCVLMLGHNAGICEMAHRLVDDPPDHPRFEDYPTCATLVASFDVASWETVAWGSGLPVDFAVPHDLMPE